jgi:hypothetical protein
VRRSGALRGKNRAYLPSIPNFQAKSLIMRNNFLGWNRLAAALCLVLAASLAPAVGAGAAETGLLHLSCTNSANGASFPVVVDLDHALVDGQPATITDTLITWRDPKGGTYELERATEKLQLRSASSTGGFFIHFTCKPG